MSHVCFPLLGTLIRVRLLQLRSLGERAWQESASIARLWRQVQILVRSVTGEYLSWVTLTIGVAGESLDCVTLVKRVW